MFRLKSLAVAVAVAAALLAIPAMAAADDAPGVFKIPGTDSTIKLYGYVQLDTTFDFSGRDPNVEGNDWAIHLPNVPLDNSAEAKVKKNQLYMTARTSRFGIQTNTPSKYGPIGVKLEGDFNAANLESGQTFTNSVLFRLRHAYGTVGGLLVGQTWSNFLDLASYPDVVDFNGPGSIALLRQPMIKYTFTLSPTMSLAVALENSPGTDGNDYCVEPSCTATANSTRMQTIPDLTANLGFSGNWGSASVRGMTSQQKRAGSLTDPTASTYSKQGFGGAVSGSFKVPGGDTVVAHVVGGSGMGRYIFNVGLSTGAAVDTGTELVNITSYAYHLGYTHVWSPEYRSNLVWSQTMIQNPKLAGVELLGPGTNKNMSQAFVNTFYSFAKNAEFGLEYGWGQRKTFGGDKGTQNRVTGTLHYNFF
jgi:hypothetical protein